MMRETLCMWVRFLMVYTRVPGYRYFRNFEESIESIVGR